MSDRDDRDDRDGSDDGERERDGGGGLGFSLPPVRLPPLFPEDLRVVFLLPGRPGGVAVSRRGLLAAAAVFDLVDAALALSVGTPVVAWGRTVAGALLASLFVGGYGALAVWEVAAVAAGYPALTVAPTLSALVLAVSLSR